MCYFDRMRNTASVLILLMILGGCGKKDAIDPAFETRTLSDQGFDHIDFTMGLEEEVQASTGAVEEIPVIGGIAGNLVQALTNATIERRGGLTLTLAPQVVDLPQIKTVDNRFIKSIVIERVDVEIPEKVRREAVQIRQSSSGVSGTSHLLEDNLNFIRKIEVYLEPVEELDPRERLVGEQELRTNWGDALLENLSTGATKVLEYNNAQDRVACEGGCISLRPMEEDLSHYIPRYGIFKIHTRIVLAKVPEGKLKVQGKIKFRINIIPPF